MLSVSRVVQSYEQNGSSVVAERCKVCWECSKVKMSKTRFKARGTRGSYLLKGASAGRRELPGDLEWYTQDKGLRSYEELKSRVSN